MYIQICSEWVLRFITYETHCRHFCQRSKTEELQITVLKQSHGFKEAINICQMYFQIFSKWFIGFKVYDARYLPFVEYQSKAIVDLTFEVIT